MRTMLATALGITGVAILGWAPTASAHHAFAAEFDANKPVNFKGTITKMEWVNPHTWLHISVRKDDGSAESWANAVDPRGHPRSGLRDSKKTVA